MTVWTQSDEYKLLVYKIKGGAIKTTSYTSVMSASSEARGTGHTDE
jgi:hypothetical protein